MIFIAPIVEGHGEVEALPKLLFRIARSQNASIRVNPPLRVKSGSFINDDDYFTKQVTLASAKAAQENGTVLILLDCEDSCPAELGPQLLQKANNVRSDVNMLVALAYREFESWFLSAAASLSGSFGLPDNIQPPLNIDRIRDAKGWLSERMDTNYDPLTHQTEFCQRFNLEQARTNSSFNRFYNRICSLFGQI